jgi:hypothetical protein
MNLICLVEQLNDAQARIDSVLSAGGPASLFHFSRHALDLNILDVIPVAVRRFRNHTPLAGLATHGQREP